MTFAGEMGTGLGLWAPLAYGLFHLNTSCHCMNLHRKSLSPV